MSNKQHVLITGCSDGGLGCALAVAFQECGVHVFATARDVSKVKTLKALDNVTVLQLDVTKSEHVTAAVAAVVEKTGGKLDYLVNNAGRNHFMPILDDDVNFVKGIFDINLFGPMALTQAFAPLLIQTKGMAIFITSTSGYVNIPFMGSYAASKRSLEIVADTLRLELAPFGVDVLSVVTGAVTSMGLTYFGDLKLPEQSLYKSIEDTVVHRAQGGDGVPRQGTKEYAEAVLKDILDRKTGRVWHGSMADMVQQSTTATHVPQSAMDAGAVMGTSLEKLGPNAAAK